MGFWVFLADALALIGACLGRLAIEHILTLERACNPSILSWFTAGTTITSDTGELDAAYRTSAARTPKAR